MSTDTPSPAPAPTYTYRFPTPDVPGDPAEFEPVAAWRFAATVDGALLPFQDIKPGGFAELTLHLGQSYVYSWSAIGEDGNVGLPAGRGTGNVQRLLLPEPAESPSPVVRRVVPPVPPAAGGPS